MSEIVLVTGMSGAGRSTVSAALEDVGWFVIDNLPVELIVRVSELAYGGNPEHRGVAFIVGRSGQVQTEALLATEKELASLHDRVQILFLDAPDDVLIARYEANRRRHPFPGATLAESVATERAMLQTIREASDLVIDTGPLNPN
ncbi:MAG TPA: RNase adapter RapZ, partial [Acidimicrobiales bacterium]|nr:RNase adapter RapZ [Acidimicrobiales bacterium]